MDRALTDAVVRRLAEAGAYERGQDYFLHGHVISLKAGPTSIGATVRGDRVYEVTLQADEGMLDYSCACGPHFCKHCVAVALACLNATKPKRKSRKMTFADAAELLKEVEQADLVAVMLEWANEDKEVRKRLMLYAARRSGPEAGAAAALQGFRDAVRTRGFLSYVKARKWARGVNEAIDNIERHLTDGHPAAVVQLCETAIELLRKVESIDDSDGHLTYLGERLESLHLRACEEAPPDGMALAKWLLAVYHSAVEKYAGLLGREGMAEYKRLAELEGAKVAANSEPYEYLEITGVMRRLAVISGDVELAVAMMSRDLSHAYDYLNIAKLYRENGRREEALQWAEKGLAAFPQKTDMRLWNFLADEYHHAGRHADAMVLMWSVFEGVPNHEAYTALREHAVKAGCWAEERERALAMLKAKTTDDRSLLVRIYLQERDVEAAWNIAQEGCQENAWLALAEAREKDHPEDALGIYWRVADSDLRQVSGGSYKEPVEMLVKAARAAESAGQVAPFQTYLTSLRAKYKHRPNFIALLDQTFPTNS
ncbi:MAG: DUF6880 family protein [Bryobacteraceae bacterium]